MDDIERFENLLDDFDLSVRKGAYLKLLEMAQRGDVPFSSPTPRVNLHFHTFFSFNAYGYSPLHIVWRARREGLAIAGSVDFDVLDAMDEFSWAGLEIGLPTTSGLETRIFLPEYHDRELSSPKEPGVAYYMGNGFIRLPEKGTEAEETLHFLKETAQGRNRKVIARVNTFLSPVQIDLEKDVLPLAPSANPTERHMNKAYDLAAERVFPDPNQRAVFWSEKLGISTEKVLLYFHNKPDFYDIMRAKLMKFGGIGYVKPDIGDFPDIGRVNRMIRELGATPSFSWLDGTRSGEANSRELLHFCVEKGVETLFIVPDRNWDLPDEKERTMKLRNLYEIVTEAKKMDFPIFVGTELNKYGQKFVDEFDSPALTPLAPYFLESAWLLWGHSVLERSSRGYASEWARNQFRTRSERNSFFARIGKTTLAVPEEITRLNTLSTEQLLNK
ncbi:MAG: hypothetical protein WCP87_01910 [Atribacterota bacterium]